MINETDSYLFEIERPQDWRLSGEPFWLIGWFLSKTSRRYIDVRAWLDDVPFTGLFGLPRPEIAALHPQREQRLAPGFSFRLRPWRNARTVRLEVADEEGGWTEFWHGPIDVQGGERLERALNPALVEPLLYRLWNGPTLFPHVPADELLRRAVLAASIVPLDLDPVPPLFGALEEPGLVPLTHDQKVKVRGWVAHEQLPVRRVVATCCAGGENEISSGLERRDIDRDTYHLRSVAHSGFEGLVDIRRTANNPVLLEVFAELENGERHLAFARRIHPVTAFEREHRDRPFTVAAYTRMFVSLVRECRRQGVRPGPGLLRTARQVRAEIRQRALPPRPWFSWERVGTLDRLHGVNTPGPRLRAVLERDATARTEGGAPEVGFIIDARGAESAELQRTLAALRAQVYARWQAVAIIELDLPMDRAAALAALAGTETRLALHRAPTEMPRAAALHAALSACPAALVAFPEVGAEIASQTTLEVAEAAHGPMGADLIFSDEDVVDPDGRHSDPQFKSGWSPESALIGFHPGQLLFVRRRILESAGAPDPAAGSAWFFDLVLRVAERVGPERVRHLGQVCYSAPAGRRTPRDARTEREALARALTRRGWLAAAEVASIGPRPFVRVAWGGDFLRGNPVTIVIATRDHHDRLVRCMEALDRTVDWHCAKLMIVDDGSRDPRTLRLFERLRQRSDLSCRVLRGPEADKPFNYARLVNGALPLIDTPLLLLLHDDVEAGAPGWLEAMAGWLSLPEVGAVGARLVDRAGRLTHAGLVVATDDGLVTAPLLGQNCADPRGWEWHAVARNVSVVSGACLMTRTELYLELKGFEEEEFGAAGYDVDYCLRVIASDRRIVYEPRATLVHPDGRTSDGPSLAGPPGSAEQLAFLRRHGAYRDAYLSSRVKLVSDGFEFDAEGFDHARRAPQPRLLLVTDHLNFEGEALFLLDYARHAVREAGLAVRVLAAEDGPLRTGFAELGIGVQLIDVHPLQEAAIEAGQAAAVQAALAQLDLHEIDLFVCNSLTCWWGVWLARAAGLASVLYVYESALGGRLIADALAPSRLDVVDEALRAATRVVFLARSTWASYAPWNVRNHHRILPAWIDLTRIEQFKRVHAREALRAQHGVGPDDLVVVNVGTVCERNGQHVFVRTIDYYRKCCADPRRLHWFLVGGCPGPYQDSLVRDLAALGIEDHQIVNATRDVYTYFRMADVLVCTSFEESIPRVLLEAMAFEVPIVGSNVDGVPEIVAPDREAVLVPAGDDAALARALRAVFDRLRLGLSTAPAACVKVTRFYDGRHVLPRHLDLAREAILAD